ncbi:MAG: AIPR family protein [Pseudomonadota bacterium]|nr:AIPR family protein [Pseudomonadota bacterium]
MSCRELLKLITDSDENLLRSVFYENVRDYQGDNRVNEDIRQTVLGIINQRDKFVLLNNGVTIVAKSITPVGREMRLRDYQIVNGCQTSHILYFNKDQLSDNSILVPVKLIATTSQALTNSIIKASNWQTEIKPEAFEALEPFHRALEEFYVHASPSSPQLHYERRSKQYLNIGVPDSHVISIAFQTMSFVGMFIEEPHHSNDMHYSKLLEKYREDKRQIFAEDHDPYPYFLSGLAFFLARNFLRSGEIAPTYKRFIYHMLLSFRIRVGGSVSLTHGFRNSKKLTDLCDRLKSVLQQRDQALEVFQATARDIDGTLKKQESTQHDIHKRKFFTTDLISVICPIAYSALVQVSPKKVPPRRPEGIVTRFGWRGYGFIADEEGNNIFVHGSEVRGKRFCELKQGQRVEFTPVYMDKGFVATDVVLLGDGE